MFALAESSMVGRVGCKVMCRLDIQRLWGATHASGGAVDLSSFGLPYLDRSWPNATGLTDFSLCRKGQVFISGGCYYTVSSVLVLKIETLCSLFVGFVVCCVFLKLI